MKKVIFTGFLSLALPFVAAAEEIVIYNSGSVQTETRSSASTGGQTVRGGESVTTGDVSASSRTQTVINAGDEGGTVYVKTETSTNGETETREYAKEIKPDEPVMVNVSAKAESDSSRVETSIQGETQEAEATVVATSTRGASIEVESVFEKAFKVVPNLFKKVFSFFWEW